MPSALRSSLPRRFRRSTPTATKLRQKIDAARERIATQVAKNAEAARDAAVDKVPAVLDAAAAAKETATGAAQHAAEAVQGAAATAADAAKEAAGTAQHAAAAVA